MTRAELAQRLGVAMEPARTAGPVVIHETDPGRFMAAFARGVASGGTVFVADPAWGERERAQFETVVAAPVPTDATAGELGWLCLPTGGSSGAIKLARHDQDTLAAAVAGFGQHFGLVRVNAVGLLPLNHVSGFMAWMRTVLTGGRYLPWDWKALAAGERPAIDGAEWVVSLVPTQLQRLLTDAAAVAWLRAFRVIFVGGGPSWPELIEAGARAGLPLAFSYGMTETAAMVAALRPEAFAAGERGSGRALPHVRLDVGADGVLQVDGASLFRGYYPDAGRSGPWRTADRASLDATGRLEVHGREDALIITGGKKVDPLEVETVLRSSGVLADVAVIGVPDAEWGQIVVACHPGADAPLDEARVEAALSGALAHFKWPKRYVALSPWPRSAQGKLSRAELVRRVAAILP